MSLIENQSYRKKMTYYNDADNDKKVSISIVIGSNHDLDKNIIIWVEQYVQGLFFSNYIDEKQYKIKKDNEKERAKKEKSMAVKSSGKSDTRLSKEEKELIAYKKRIGIDTSD